MHAQMVGFDGHPLVFDNLVDMYTRCGLLIEVLDVLLNMDQLKTPYVCWLLEDGNDGIPS